LGVALNGHDGLDGDIAEIAGLVLSVRYYFGFAVAVAVVVDIAANRDV